MSNRVSKQKIVIHVRAECKIFMFNHSALLNYNYRHIITSVFHTPEGMLKAF